MQKPLSAALAACLWAAALAATLAACGSTEPAVPGVSYVNENPAPATVSNAGNGNGNGNVTPPSPQVLHFRSLPIVSATDPTLCLDAAGTVNGARVQAAACTGLPNQAWVLRDGQLVVYENKCLDLPAGSDPTTAPFPVINDCNSTLPNQIWADYNDTLRVVGSVQCLTVTADATANGKAVTVAPCKDSADADRWILGNAGQFNIVPYSDPNQCVGTADGSAAAGSALTVVACKATLGQRWALATNQLTLNGLCLDAPSLMSGGAVQLAACTGASTQLWFWQNLTRMSGANLCLDVAGGKVVASECVFANTQRLYFGGAL